MRALGLLLGLALCGGAQAWDGVVTHVTDGDTLWLAPDAGGAPVKLRVQGIDAPERCQAWGPQAKAALNARVLHQHVQVQTRAYDDYQRAIGSLALQEEDIAAWMVREGHAWSYHYRRSLGPYAAQEQEARAARRGLFAASAVEPREFRKLHGPCGP
ncbi:MAG TPA: thermonuclease family protein [Rhizobacter sp.]|jgi:endonuclease YncB( thermonuclease family)|nr:thermonuclease family protein [Rhizobacter sp.]